jgi:murein L,D-transpeptidase YcbB/YkuD
MLAAAPAGAADGVSASLEAALRSAIGAVARDMDAGSRDSAGELQQFYERRGFRPVWSADGRPNERGATLLEMFQRAGEDGLEPRDYAVPMATAGGDAGAAAVEIGLARALQRYACDLRAGRVEPAPDDGTLFVARRRSPYCDVLDGAAEAPDVRTHLARYAPQSAEYARLKTTLAAYRERAGRGGWSAVPPGPTLKPGMRDPRIAQLRRALADRGELPDTAAAEPEAFDAGLEQALRRFQRRHGLAADGALGPQTLAAVNVPVERRIDQIVVNMERRRWMPDELGRKYVFVNIADFTLKLVDGPRTLYDSRVIVGTPYQRSPTFSTAITGFEINPYWNVPDSIARKEMLPRIKRDPGYLAANDLRLLAIRDGRTAVVDPATVDWSALGPGRFPYRIRQEPGDGNALGHIKFAMPNRWDIYLHDTPSRNLFERPVRSFSHGCIRVEHPFELALRLLDGGGGWTAGKLAEAADSGRRQRVRLPAAVPVHLAYLTAWTNRDQSLHFREDIYGRDRRLEAALGRGAVSY